LIRSSAGLDKIILWPDDSCSELLGMTSVSRDLFQETKRKTTQHEFVAHLGCYAPLLSLRHKTGMLYSSRRIITSKKEGDDVALLET